MGRLFHTITAANSLSRRHPSLLAWFSVTGNGKAAPRRSRDQPWRRFRVHPEARAISRYWQFGRQRAGLGACGTYGVVGVTQQARDGLEGETIAPDAPPRAGGDDLYGTACFRPLGPRCGGISRPVRLHHHALVHGDDAMTGPETAEPGEQITLGGAHQHLATGRRLHARRCHEPNVCGRRPRAHRPSVRPRGSVGLPGALVAAGLDGGGTREVVLTHVLARGRQRPVQVLPPS